MQHAPQKVPVPLQEPVKAKLEELEAKGVIAKVTTPTPWINSMVAVTRKEKLRICLDPKDLNKALLRSPHPMTTIDDIIPQLANAKIFTVMDAKDGFWQVELDDDSSYLTTFWTPFGRYRWKRMPFGLSTSSEEFQRRQAEALEGIPGTVSIVDDVLIFGKGDTIDEAIRDHDRNQIAVMEGAQEANLVFNPAKIRLRLPRVAYCGHIFSAEGLTPDPEKVKAIQQLKEPTSVKELQRFLGTVNYLAKFLPRLSDVSEPLRKLLVKDVDWMWLEEQQKNLHTSQRVGSTTASAEIFQSKTGSYHTVRCQ